MIAAAARAEWFKVVRRPGLWITTALFLVQAVGIGYVATYVLVSHVSSAAVGSGGESLSDVRLALYPASLIPKTVANADTLQAVFALIAGVLVQGSEYGWHTLKTSFIQLPGRLSVVIGRLVALALVIALMTVAVFLLAAIASQSIARVDGRLLAFPSLVEIARAVGGEWLILMTMAAFGLFLATLFRQSAIAIGFGIPYVLVIESLGLGLLGSFVRVVRQVHPYFPVASAGFVQRSYGQVAELVGLSVGGGPAIGTGRAALDLVGWLAAFVVGSLLLTRFRDVA